VRTAGIEAPTLVELPASGYRHRARLAVRGRATSPKVGLFQAGSHRIADTPRCPIHHPAINAAALEIRTAIRETGTAPYAEGPHRGALRYLQLVIERSTQRVQVVLIGNGSTASVLVDLPSAVERRLGSQLQGLFFNGQPERSNAILGPHWNHLAGEPTVKEKLGGVTVHFPPGAFGQGNLPLFDRAIARIHGLVREGAIVAECHAGVGAIGLGLLARSAAVRFNERSTEALIGLELGLADRPQGEQAKASLFAGAAGERLDALAGAEIVIVDPPRRGLDAALCRALAESPPERLVYLSCGIDSLARDLATLTASGALRVAGIEAYAFLPFTEHVETLVWLDRAAG
jgi:tRNA/tmRNA/rRNA uracil-C5-methylase (TrmA/RlmC/RlmD family)